MLHCISVDEHVEKALLILLHQTFLDIAQAITQFVLHFPSHHSVLLPVLGNRFPMPLDATNNDDVYVGRVRRDISREDKKGLDLFVCGDQIKKGAALNAVQIAELVLKN